MYSILIADDEKWIRKGIIAKLNYHGFVFSSVYEAEDGEEAIEIIKQKQPQIVITDVRMPNIDGIELIRKTKVLYNNIKFIIISGFAEFEYVQKAMSLGVEDYILKPIADEQLSSTVKKVIAELDNEARIEDISIKEIELKKANETYQLEYEINEVFNTPNIEDNEILLEKIHENKAEYKYIIAIIHLHTREKNSDYQDYKAIKGEIIEVVKNILNEYDDKIVNNLRDVNQLFVVMMKKDSTMLKNKSEEYMQRAYNLITKNIYPNITIALSDTGQNVSYKLYHQAKRVLALRLIYGNNKVYKYREFETNLRNNFIYPEDKIKMLSRCMEIGDLKNIEFIVKDMFSYETLNNKNDQYINTLYSACVNIMVKICNQEGIDMNEVMPSEMITGECICSYNNCEELAEDICITIIDIKKQKDMNCCLNSMNIVSQTEKYIEEHYSEEFTVNELAHRFCINPTYYSNLFSKQTGFTISKYITKTRIKNACKLLEGTSISVADISLNAGYQDLQYFYRVFKKEIKLTPTEYRKQHSN